MIKGVPVYINEKGRVARPQDLITQWQKPLPDPNGIALTNSELEQLKREIAFKIWKRQWSTIFMKDNGSDYDESPDSQDCKDVFEEVYEQVSQATKKEGER